MQFRLDIFGVSLSSSPSTVLFSPDITVESWSKRINAPGKMSFSMDASNEKATPDTLQLYRIVRLYHRYRDGTAGYSPVWLGYISAVQQNENRIEVICMGMLNLFKKRWAGTNQEFTGEGSDEAFGLLDDTNSDDGDTGIEEGDGGVTSTKDVKASGDVTIFHCWELLAQAHNAEFEIDDTGTFNFVDSLGSDKSGTVRLIFRLDGKPGSNVTQIDYGQDGEDMATQVIGRTTAGGGLDSTRPTAPSANQTTYGMLIERRQFNEAQDQPTLDAMTDALLSQIENPISEFNVEPVVASKKLNTTSGEREVSGLQYEDVSVGDLIYAFISTRNQTVDQAKRIAELTVTVDETGDEKMSFTLSEAGVFVTADFLDANRVTDLVARVKQIESVLS